ncbi:MAG TPA: aryl-sulfate sulfotransferase [Candidatus Sulfotelmatobacter sp.]|jgi:hypothetical protein|nr:aryl-sulfate sulfotransferase [Candidatus Sulfotelmatobacter sp.]
MKNLAPLRPFVVFAILTLAAFTTACGTSGTSNPAARAYVQSTANPLVAQLTVVSPCAGQAMVQFGPDTSYGRTTAWYPVSPMFSPSRTLQQTNILVAGMRASTTYHMQSVVQCSDNAVFTTPDLTFATGPLPSLPFPTLTVTRPNPSSTSPENPGIEMITVTIPGVPALFTDRDANPIWYYDVGAGSYPFPFKLLPNGHMILVIGQPTPSVWSLREIDLAGNTIREMDTTALAAKMQAAGFDFAPQYYHHDIVPLPNGHLIVLTNFTLNVPNVSGYSNPTPVIVDGLIDLDQNWNPVWAWNGFDHLDVNRHLNGLPDWTHSNAVVYLPSDGNLLLSMRHQSWVLKIDYNNGIGTGDILWKLGYQGDFQLTQGGVPADDDPSLWFSFQHFPSLISQSGTQTNLAIWDNGNSRPLDTNGTLCGVAPAYTPCYSRATVFQLDEGSKVADLFWSTAPGAFGFWGGSINQLDNGNVEFDLNAATPPISNNVASEVQEVTQTSAPQIVWKLDITPLGNTAYRAYRVPSLYPGISWQY